MAPVPAARGIFLLVQIQIPVQAQQMRSFNVPFSAVFFISLQSLVGFLSHAQMINCSLAQGFIKCGFQMS